ncbi:MAG TPA: NADH-quinone oxidoreductase subunit J [Thermoanaerobaculia bacterium]|nr:NADH-quinone oxidoreductase subunit J [Thermoanaerobaculia bacterium]
MIEVAVFLLFAALALGSALMVVLLRNPVHSTLSLVLTLLAIAVLFVLLGAPFLAALQVLVYTGAIVVLFLFVVMLLNIGREEIATDRGLVQKGAAGLGALILLGMVGAALWQGTAGHELAPLTEDFVSLEVLATQLFGRYLVAFELVGLLLLVAVIAATVLAARPTPGEPLAAGDRLADAAPVERGGPEPEELAEPTAPSTAAEEAR